MFVVSGSAWPTPCTTCIVPSAPTPPPLWYQSRPVGRLSETSCSTSKFDGNGAGQVHPGCWLSEGEGQAWVPSTWLGKYSPPPSQGTYPKGAGVRVGTRPARQGGLTSGLQATGCTSEILQRVSHLAGSATVGVSASCLGPAHSLPLYHAGSRIRRPQAHFVRQQDIKKRENKRYIRMTLYFPGKFLFPNLAFPLNWP